ncbi:MAG: hypothetical protein HXY39_00400 [Chloroflexi bacterium]|nr:hypothetical protein [Chloroflexota bacterium]
MRVKGRHSIIGALAVLRRVIGIVLLAIGMLGLLLPVLPGWPLVIPGIVLLGRRDRLVRLSHLVVRVVLRRLRQSRSRHLRVIGVRLSIEYVRTRRALIPTIAATERVFARVLAWS